ncbi:tRNA1(Val) (adenine(37)-N6)-methyltransferase [Streptococcus oricebi]|uniref:SAM-dependent methyltransferase n=1 Tax=Streptococcus oricebi TaxID=1547447 RepID=A0ABS5B1G0_9STRE|nr:tRNA1(Val) (adenine(37)-N6)-methyltransferase [Streptococcus oricebi]MBP2622667.1 SAM-dependent methyltransferase [Streptococcus oricebi]
MEQVKLQAGERLDQLASSQLKIIQNREVFSYSVDSLLLARFPKLPQKGLIVDLCAGNGAVGLFASTRTTAQIIGVELQERLADMAQRSIILNGLDKQIRMIQDDLKNLPQYLPGSRVDVMLCNPPYFKVSESSNKNQSPYYLLARHEIATNLGQICRTAQQTLKSNGRLVMVHRPDRFLDILETMKSYKLAPKRLQFVYPKLGKEANMLLIEAIKDGSADGFKVLPPLFIHEADGSYSPEIHQLYYGK